MYEDLFTAMRDPELGPIWIEAARSLGIEVVRGGDSYVYYDGHNLHIADDEHLDEDDRLGQLIFHELCHGLVQGEARWHEPDWGLDNTTGADLWREFACLRLQAHLLDGYGGYALRRRLHPTTPERPFYEALPERPLDPVDGDLRPEETSSEGDALALAQTAAMLAHTRPYRPVLTEALGKTVAVLGLPRHPRTALPLHADETRRCATCAWRSENGFCRHAVEAPALRDDDRACVRHQPSLDCQRCGACCRAAYDAVYLDPREKAIKRHPDLVGVQGFVYYLKRSGDRCAALAGPKAGPYQCTIYDDRPRTCRDFENGGRHCLDARRKIGLEAMPLP